MSQNAQNSQQSTEEEIMQKSLSTSDKIILSDEDFASFNKALSDSVSTNSYLQSAVEESAEYFNWKKK
ncbi:MAG: hypothetical protein RLZZ107_326 [Bacteroidota bacterium]